MFNFLKKTFFNPKVAFFIFLFFIIGYLVLLDEEGAFQKKFLNFGPSEDTKFLGMKVDTWSKVIIVYCIGFVSSLLTSYYGTVMFDFIHQYIWNPAYTKKIDMSKSFTSIIVTTEPLLYWILQIINFFVKLTMELQYLIPQFLGYAIIDIPYNLYKVSLKKFTST